MRLALPGRTQGRPFAPSPGQNTVGFFRMLRYHGRRIRDGVDYRPVVHGSFPGQKIVVVHEFGKVVGDVVQKLFLDADVCSEELECVDHSFCVQFSNQVAEQRVHVGRVHRSGDFFVPRYIVLPRKLRNARFFRRVVFTGETVARIEDGRELDVDVCGFVFTCGVVVHPISPRHVAGRAERDTVVVISVDSEELVVSRVVRLHVTQMVRVVRRIVGDIGRSHLGQRQCTALHVGNFGRGHYTGFLMIYDQQPANALRRTHENYQLLYTPSSPLPFFFVNTWMKTRRETPKTKRPIS